MSDPYYITNPPNKEGEIYKECARGRWDYSCGRCLILGVERYDPEIHGGRSISRLIELGITLDCRGDLKIHKTVNFSYGVAIWSSGHKFDKHGYEKKWVPKEVMIERCAFIGANAVLYNCWIMHHAVVGAGAVVNGRVVPSYTMVEGNPAMVIARLDKDKDANRYVRLSEPEPLERV